VTSPLTLRLSRVLIACLVVLVIGAVSAVPASAALPSAEQDFVTRINQERTSRSLKALTVCGGLLDVARAWSDKRVATSNHVGHNPSYTSQIPSGWTRAAENVAWGSGTSATVAVLHKALMNSSGHRANILGDFTHIGVGVTVVSNEMYVTQNFGKYPNGCGSTTTSITLTVTKGTWDDGTKSKAILKWSGAAGSNVDIWRNGAKLTTTANDGGWNDKFSVKLAAGTVRSYKVCQAGTTTCSATKSVTF
jgi:hypothetical protein